MTDKINIWKYLFFVGIFIFSWSIFADWGLLKLRENTILTRVINIEEYIIATQDNYDNIQIEIENLKNLSSKGIPEHIPEHKKWRKYKQ